MLNIKKKNFLKVERIIRLLSTKKLKRAKEHLKISKKTTDKGINQLLKSLLLYGFRQPMSKKYRQSI